MVGSRTLLLLSMLALGARPEHGRTTAEVMAARLEVFGGPTDAALPTGWLKRGGLVAVVGEEPGGWIAIVPPRGSFSWIADDAIQADGRGQGRVVANNTPVRPGSNGARMPGSPQTRLRPGDRVVLLDRPKLVLRQKGEPRTYLAIEPTIEEVRYVRAEGLGPIRTEGVRTVADSGLSPPIRQASSATEPEVSISREFADAGPILDESGLPVSLANRLAQIEQDHRAILRQPVETWRLGTIRQSYETLLKETTDSAAQAALRARLDRVNQQDAVAKTSATLEDVLGRSRSRDVELAEAQAQTLPANRRQARSHDAEGLLQISSKQADGQRVFALIAESGETTAYLRLPTGLAPEPYLTKRIGVRGIVRYDETLRARVITVRELERLADPPSRRR
ncbi:MAG: hypothetical protein ABI353_21765 [Isosphaeraceae bacterium]